MDFYDVTKSAARKKKFFGCILLILASTTGAETPNHSPDTPYVIVLKQHIAARSQGGVRFNYLPFRIPPNVTRIDFWDDYNPVAGNNVVDIGLFDARAKNPATSLEGYRGKSPRSREAAFLTATSAGYGYTPGPLDEGDWYIFLDAYKVQPGGVDVAVKIVLTLAGHAAPEPHGPWLRGDLHMHTLHSDGALTVPALAGMARRNGLDFICITDHNVASQDAEIDVLQKKRFFPILRGAEVTTDGGHFNACGLPAGSVLDFRIDRGDQTRLNQVTAEGHRLGALLTANHPFADCPACDWSFDQIMPGFDAMEVWNGNWDPSDEKAVRLWDTLLKVGRRITALACSDTHRDSPGSPTTVVRVDSARQEDLFRAIRAGHAYLEKDPQGGDLLFEAVLISGDRKQTFGIGDTVELPTPGDLLIRARLSSNPNSEGTISLLTTDGVVFSQKITGDDEAQTTAHFDKNGYIRLEIRDTSGRMLVMSNPIFVKIRSGSA
jgi:hypothetical protein